MFAVLPDNITDLEEASVLVNPLTVLAFSHTTKQEGLKASAHIAAILHLCRMMVKQCRDEGIPLVNIVKEEDRVEVLKATGAEYVVNSLLPSVTWDFLTAVKPTRRMTSPDQQAHDDATSGHSSDDRPPPAVGREGCR